MVRIVINKNLNKLSDLGRKSYNEVFKRMGRSDITLNTKSETTDTFGQTTSTWTTSTIKAIFQPITYKDKELLSSGWVEVGNAILIAKYDASYSEEDYITVDGNDWAIIDQKSEPLGADGQVMFKTYKLILKK